MNSNRLVKVLPKNALSLHPNLSLHKSLKVVILFGNCLGLLPVNGITSDSVESVIFKWTSPKTLYTLTFMLVLLIKIIWDFLHFLKNGLLDDKAQSKFSNKYIYDYIHNINDLLAIMFAYILMLLKTLGFLQLARKWPILIKKWFEVETAMQKNYHLYSNLNLKIKLQFAFYLISTAGK